MPNDSDPPPQAGDMEEFLAGVERRVQGGSVPAPPLVIEGAGVPEEAEKKMETAHEEWEEAYGEAWRKAKRPNDRPRFRGLIIGTSSDTAGQ